MKPEMSRRVHSPSRILGALIGLSILSSVPSAAAEAAITVDPATAAAYFETTARLAADEGGRLWGVDLYGPMLFVDPGSRSLVANREDPEGLLRPTDGVWVGTLPPEIGCANTAVDWQDRRWTMLLWPLPDDSVDRNVLMFHEMFHRIQPALGLPARDPANDHLATRDGRYWLRLEWRALERALESEGEARRRAVTDALLFRNRRRALFPEATETENALEINEGLAEYTGVRVGTPSPEYAVEYAVEGLERREEGIDRISPVRGFAYASGPAYGLLLDDADAGWTQSVSEGGERDLGELLRRVSEIRLPDESSLEKSEGAIEFGEALEARAEAYGGAELAVEEDDRQAEREAEQRRLREKFVQGPRIVLPVADEFQYGFNPNAARVLHGVGTVYDSAQVRDAWGSLTVEGGGVLLQRREGGIVGIVVSAPPEPEAPTVEGEGWILRLDPGWVLALGDREDDWVVHPSESSGPGSSGGSR